MQLRSIELEGFRNYDRQRVEFDRSVNVIIGDNAQGKTNLLEAVYAFSCAKAFRARTDREAIGFGRDRARLRAEFLSGGREQTAEIIITEGRRKQIIVNGAKLKTTAELSGRLNAVLFCPDDLEMVRAGAAVRRRLMDGCLCQMRPRYTEILSSYNRTLEQKSRILRDWREKQSLLEMLDEYNARLIELGARLIGYRARMVRAMSAKAQEIHSDFSGGREELKLSYVTVSTVTNPFAPAAETAEQLAEHQARHRRAELESGLCLSGAHKDDIEMTIDSRSAKQFASQGQIRTAALSVKLAQRELLQDDTGEYPLLLLDDVLSELDAGRRSFVLSRIGGGQVMITCCADGDISGSTGGRIIRVSGGVIA